MIVWRHILCLFCSFFGSGGSGQTSDGTFRLTADPDWDSVNGYTF